MDISNRLQGFLGKLPTETIIRNIILSFLENRSVKINRSSIHVQKNNQVYLDISPIIKDRIITWFPEIIEVVNRELQEKEYSDQVKRIF